MCPEKKLIVEVDGTSHLTRKKKDAIRDAAMINDGYRIVRFTNTQVRESRDWVLQQIYYALEADYAP